MKPRLPAEEIERFLEWLRPEQQDLENYGRRLLWDSQELPDAINNAMMRAIAHFDRCLDAAHFRAWMFKILTHEALALNRKHARIARFEFQVEPQEMESLAGTEPASCWGLPLELSNWQEGLEDHLDLALKSLTDSERAVLLLRAIGSFKYREIADELELPIGSVMGYLARARKKMQAALRRRKDATLEES
jgi:RNA polymerase sigma-70 factor (ECF subfamily)